MFENQKRLKLESLVHCYLHYLNFSPVHCAMIVSRVVTFISDVKIYEWRGGARPSQCGYTQGSHNKSPCFLAQQDWKSDNRECFYQTQCLFHGRLSNNTHSNLPPIIMKQVVYFKIMPINDTFDSSNCSHLASC